MIVEDQNMPRQLFEMLVEASDRYETAVSIDNAAVADIYCMRGGIDLVLMDVVTKNGANGLDAAAKIKKHDPKIKVIIVTSMPEYSYLERAREAGVDSFWYKDISRELSQRLQQECKKAPLEAPGEHRPLPYFS